MDLRKLKTIFDLFENSSLSEMEFCEGEEKIRLSKVSPVGASVVLPTSSPGVAMVSDTEQSQVNEVAQLPLESGGEKISGTVVKSPMVGTFYRSSAPDKPPFVRVGQSVSVGDTLCILESMKLMNEIPSPVAGTVKEILMENSEPVSFGAKLFIIE